MDNKYTDYKKENSERVYKMKIWDTAGQERFHTMTSAFYKRADAILVCYDITDRITFEKIKFWLESIDKAAYPDVPRMIIANKCDLNDYPVKHTVAL